MGLVDWIKNRNKDRSQWSPHVPEKTKSASSRDAKQEKPSEIRRNDMPFRFEKPFAHLEYLMTEQERNVVDRIEARWKARYEQVRDYPPMSETQDHEANVFRAVDDAYRTLVARERAPFEQWKRLEADADRAIGDVQRAFSKQRNWVEQVMPAARHSAQSGPAKRRRQKGPDIPF